MCIGNPLDSVLNVLIFFLFAAASTEVGFNFETVSIVTPLLGSMFIIFGLVITVYFIVKVAVLKRQVRYMLNLTKRYAFLLLTVW